MSRWETARLGDIAQVIGRGIAPNYDDKGDVVVLNQKCIRDGRVNVALSRRHGGRPVPLAKQLQAGDVLVNSTGVGTLGRTAGFQGSADVVTVDSHVTILRPGSADPTFLRFLVRHLEPVIEALAEGSTGQTELSRQRLAEVEAPLPPLREQRAIAAVLAALDDKIESNRRVLGAVDALVRAEFAGAVADSASKEVSFAEIAERMYQPADPRQVDPATPYIGLEHMPRGSMILDNWGCAAGLESGKSFFERGDVLFGKLRPNFRKVGVAPVSGVCSTDVLVLRPRRGLGLLAAVASSLDLNAYATAAASGTKMPRVSWEYLAEYRTVVPVDERAARLEEVLVPMLQRSLCAVEESRSLAVLRDALLPELLSGRMRVRDAEAIAEEVA